MDRALIFWGVCIPTRTYLTYLARQGSDTLRIFALVIGTRWLTGFENGNEGFFGGPTFWADERPVHGALWVAYALTDEWRFLAADTVFGAGNWLNFRMQR